MTNEDNKSASAKSDPSKSKDDKKDSDKDKKESEGAALTESDIALFKRYGKGPYTDALKKIEEDTKGINQKISSLCGIKESDTGLALPAQWNL
jgi:26S proteasome regulatory subunit T1